LGASKESGQRNWRRFGTEKNSERSAVADDNAHSIHPDSARAVKLQELTRIEPGGKPVFAGHFELIQGVKVQLAVSVGKCELTIAELFALKEGSVIALDQPSDAPVDIHLDGKLIGRGEIVVVGDNFGIRITELGGTSAS
jgi:flagellar motor switch protein FliN/FliY